MINRESLKLATLGLAAVVLVPFAFKNVPLEKKVQEKTPVAIEYSQPKNQLTLTESPHNYISSSPQNQDSQTSAPNQDYQTISSNQNSIDNLLNQARLAVSSLSPYLNSAKEFIKTKVEESKRPYKDFKFQDELEPIRFHSYRIGVDLATMLAIRIAENGGPNKQFGVMPSPRYDNDKGYSMNGKFHEYPKDKGLTKQMSISACTVKKNWERYQTLTGVDYNALSEKKKEVYMLRFIKFHGSRYAPEDAENDPDNLNINWIDNVKTNYLHFKQEEEKLKESKEKK